jgi:hypothetical protein
VLAALEPVVAGAAEKPVSAIVAEEVVVAAKAANRVVPVTSIDEIVAGGDAVGGIENVRVRRSIDGGHCSSFPCRGFPRRRDCPARRPSPTQPCCRSELTPAATASAAVRWLRERLRRFPYCVSRARDRYSADLCGPCSPDRRPDVETHSHAHQACRPACSATEQIRAGDNLRTAKAIGLELPRTLLTR